jgi:hypothetical protein
VAPVFPICGRPLVLFRVQLLCLIFIRRCLLVGAVQDQVQFGCFVLRLGASWASFGLLSREGFSRVFPCPPPPWGQGAAGPCGGPRAVSVVSLSWPDPVFHLVLLILGRVQESFGSRLPTVSFCCRPVGPSASLG